MHSFSPAESDPVGPVGLEIPIVTVPTPNPDALMFRVEEALVPTGTWEYRRERLVPGGPEDSPLAQRLLALAGVDLVLIAPRFVTVGKDPDARWPDIVPSVKEELRALISSGEMAVFDQGVDGPQATSELEARILAVIDDEIRPAIAQDGGDVVYGGFEDGIVKLQLIGSCGTCPSSVTTLKMGIERMLMEEFPEVSGVEQM